MYTNKASTHESNGGEYEPNNMKCRKFCFTTNWYTSLLNYVTVFGVNIGHLLSDLLLSDIDRGAVNIFAFFMSTPLQLSSEMSHIPSLQLLS